MAEDGDIRATPKADSVQWMGPCPCGCGAHYAMLLDADGDPIAVFGWQPEGWADFMAGVAEHIKGESTDGTVFEHHTAH